jgi:microcystin-dependent protein
LCKRVFLVQLSDKGVDVSEPFLAEIRMVGFNFAPRGWAFCDGQILPISQNQALFSLLGTNYGGDGRTTFALPDLRGRVPVHPGFSSIRLGDRGGEENHTLDVNELPQHTHTVTAAGNQATASSVAGNVLSSQARRGFAMYNNSGMRQRLDNSSVSQTGGGQAHDNMQPYLTLNFVIAIQGLYPSRS